MSTLMSLLASSKFPLSPNSFTAGGKDRDAGDSTSTFAPVSKRFRSPVGARVTFLLRGQEKSNPKRRPPRLALAGRPARQVREAGPGFSSGLLPARKGESIPGLARCAASSSPPHRRPGAPDKAARSCAQKQQQQQLQLQEHLPCERGREAASARGSAFAPASGAHDARLLLWGPSAAVGRGRSGRAAGVAKDGNAFSTGQEPGRKARPRLTDFTPMDGRKAPPRGVVFSWLLLFWTSKREVARAATAVRNRFEACAGAEARAPLTPTLSPNDEAVGGEGAHQTASSGMEGRTSHPHAQDVAHTSTGARP